ncbi:MAG TPA: calcium-binding protein [Actinomycetota bacterium]|nr:calcium-binding protein [Actinomycetota bacterium]
MGPVLAPTRRIVALCLSVAAAAVPSRATAEPGPHATTTRASAPDPGQRAAAIGDDSFSPSISADGQLVAFASSSADLVPGDTNGGVDIFIHDRRSGLTERVSVASSGEQAVNRWGYFVQAQPSISSDGRFVAFSSQAMNLVTGGTSGESQIYVRDRLLRTTELVSQSKVGGEPDDGSHGPSISGDGRFVAFSSDATDLVDGDDEGEGDVFIRNRQTAQTSRISIDRVGRGGDNDSWAPAMSADGAAVAFTTLATNLRDTPTAKRYSEVVVVHDFLRATNSQASVDDCAAWGQGIHAGKPAVSHDGRHVSYSKNCSASDWPTNVYIYDRDTQATELVSVDADGSRPTESSLDSAVSGDGRYVAFWSSSSRMVRHDNNDLQDVFVRDRHLDTTYLASVSSTGDQARSLWGGGITGGEVAISRDGMSVAFSTWADGLTTDDFNNAFDIYVHQRFGSPCGDSPSPEGLVSRPADRLAARAGDYEADLDRANCSVVIGNGL